MKTTLHLMGSPSIAVGPDLHPLPQTRPAWLLYYLADEGTWVTRAHLAYLFRADSPESVARHYIRNLLNRARRLPHVENLSIEPTRCRWEVPTDLERFKRAIRTQKWHQALTCYGGRFLDGLTTSGSAVFDAWVEARRHQLHEDWRDATVRYAADQEASERHRSAMSALERYLDVDLLDEEVLQVYLRNAYLSGQREEALKMAHAFIDHLAEDLDLVPLPPTLDLIERIRNGEPVERAEQATPRRRRWTDAVESGRDELQELILLLKDPNNRLQTVVDSERGGAETVIVSRQVHRPGVVHYAIVELVETLLAEGHHKRAVELMILVMSQAPREDAVLRQRVERVWDRLAAYVSREMIRDVRERW